jgi:RNA polymerase sigma-70 factor (ECF subfamily)
MATEWQAQTEDIRRVERARQGDQAAFAWLVERYRDVVQAEVQHLVPDAADTHALVEAVFQQAQQELASFDGAVPFDAWLRAGCAEWCGAALAEPPATPDHDNDEARWVRQTLEGDQDAFAALFERYSGLVYTHAYYRLSNASDAQEALQEIFHRAYVKLDMFDPRRSFRAWLMTIATNYCTDMLRRRMSLKRMVQQVPLDVVDYHIADTEANPEHTALHNEQREQVRRALRQLPDAYREVMVLFYWNDLSYQEIVDATGLKESTVKTRLHRGRARLIELLEGQLPE